MNKKFQYRKNVCLKNISRWKIGGKADYFIEPLNLEELKYSVYYAKKNNLAFRIIGDGTNILFDDRGYHGLIIKIGRNFSKININENNVTAEAGAWVPCLARMTANYGLSGLEHTIGIPGTVGGLVLMNGGSLRKSISESINKVYAIDQGGNTVVFQRDECGFSYRTSVFQELSVIIYKVELRLNYEMIAKVRNEMINILENRRKKFPIKYPNCGSVFISNPKLYHKYGPPGKIIEDLGLKGYTIGGAMVSNVHANFIINKGNANSEDIIELIKYIKTKVYEKTNVWIESEIRHLPSKGKFTFLHKL